MVPAFGHDLLYSLKCSVAGGQVVVLCCVVSDVQKYTKESLTALIIRSADTFRAVNDSNSQQMALLLLP